VTTVNQLAEAVKDCCDERGVHVASEGIKRFVAQEVDMVATQLGVQRRSVLVTYAHLFKAQDLANQAITLATSGLRFTGFNTGLTDGIPLPLWREALARRVATDPPA
jgi:hypothetical protein